MESANVPNVMAASLHLLPRPTALPRPTDRLTSDQPELSIWARGQVAGWSSWWPACSFRGTFVSDQWLLRVLPLAPQPWLSGGWGGQSALLPCLRNCSPDQAEGQLEKPPHLPSHTRLPGADWLEATQRKTLLCITVYFYTSDFFPLKVENRPTKETHTICVRDNPSTLFCFL